MTTNHPLTSRGGSYRVSLRPYFTHDRTIITAIVLICGTFLLTQFHDETAVFGLVGSMWTLALTFWFRVDKDTQ